MTKFPVLLHDDQQEIFDSWKDVAYEKYNIDLSYFRTWEEAELEIGANPEKYVKVILDYKGQDNEDSPGEDSGYLYPATTFLNERKIEFVILTGWADECRVAFRKVDVYQKGSQEESMFSNIQKEIKSKNYLWVNHPEIEDIFELGYLPKANKNDILHILENINKTDVAIIKNNLAASRRVFESIMKELHYMNVIPDEFVTGEIINFEYSTAYLKGKVVRLHRDNRAMTPPGEIVPRYLHAILDIFKNTGSSGGSHHNEYQLKPYISKSIIYGLFEFLLWYGDFRKAKMDSLNK
jgi:hypothetical protein